MKQCSCKVSRGTNRVLYGTLSDQARLVSEAVPPAVAHALGRALRQQLVHD